MAIRKIPRAPLAAAALLVGSSAALALTGDEVLNKLNDDQSFGYLAGSAEMAAMVAGAQGNTRRRDCIIDWFYEKNGASQLTQALTRYKDRPAQPVIYAVINRACGE